MQADQLFTGGTVRTGVPGAQPSTALAVAGGRVLALGQDALDSRGPGTEATDLAGGALRPSVTGMCIRCWAGSACRGAGAPGPQRGRDPGRGRGLGRRAPRRGVGDRRRVRSHAGPRRPVRRPLAGHGGRRPAGGAAHDGLPHHVGQQQALRRAGIDAQHPRADRGPDRAPPGRLAAGHPARVGAIGPVLDLLPAPGPAEQAAALAEVRRCSPPPGSPGSRTPGSTRTRWTPGWPPRAPACCGSAPTWRSGPSRPCGRTSSRIRRRPGPGLRDGAGLANRPDGEVLRRRRSRSRHRRTAAAVPGLPALARDRQLDAPSSPTRSPRPTRRASRPTCTPSATAGSAWPWTRRQTARRNGPADRRPVLAHVQLIDPADLPRFAALGVIANLEPLWAQPDPLMTELTLPRVGPPAAPASTRSPPAAFRRPRLVRQRLAGHRLPTAGRHRHRGDPADPRGDPDGGWLPAERVTAAGRWPPTPPALPTRRSRNTAGAAAPRHARRPDPPRRRPNVIPARDLRDLPVLGTWLAGTRTRRPNSPTPATIPY